MKYRILWGVFLIFAAVYLVVSNLGYLPAIGIWSFVFTVVCLSIIIASLKDVNIFGILLPLAVIATIFKEQLGIQQLVPWTVFIVAILASIGLELLLKNWKKNRKKKKKNKFCTTSYGNKDVDASDETGENIELETSFNGLIKYIKSDNLKYVSLKSKFAGCKLYFDSACVPSNNVVVDIESSFSGIELYVPKNWTVLTTAEAHFGAVNIKDDDDTEKGSIVMTVQGETNFGAIDVKFI